MAKHNSKKQKKSLFYEEKSLVGWLLVKLGFLMSQAGHKLAIFVYKIKPRL